MAEFDIKSPSTMRKDMEDYLRDRAKLNKLRESGTLTAEEFSYAARDLERRYSNSISQEDCYRFDTAKEYKDFLDYLDGLNPGNRDQIDWTLEHETEHSDAISGDSRVKKLSYCMWLLKEEDGSTSGFPAIEVVAESGDDYLDLRKKSIDGVTEKSDIDNFDITD